MPGIYYTVCRKCGANLSEIDCYDSLYWEGKEIPLRHPGESSDLEKLTREQAARTGILHRFTAYGCRGCGSVSYVKTLALPTVGTGVSLLLLLVSVAAFAKFVSSNPWWCALAAAIVILPFIMLDVYLNRLRTSRRHGFIADTSCKECASSDTAVIGQLLFNEKAALRCGSCGERQRRLDRTAIS
jgi:Zn ribbon nucleic-acid-binding protein